MSERKSAGMRSDAIHRCAAKTVIMRVATLTLLLVLAVPAIAADSAESECLSKEAQREAIVAHQAVPLAQAIRTIRPKNKGEVIRAKLCRRPNGLVYLLTLLSRNGKVTHATVDAANGTVVGGG
ncbi:MAG: PepSY domain-containing protein [Pseudolabrys sp.]|nr:PepSY domain-containing protein [Pseudolabrys sp.]